MKTLKNLLLGEINQFNELGHQFINGEITRGDFKGISGQMGVYAHRDGKNFMIRLRVPSGVTSRENLKKIYDLAEKQQLESVHLTTRQDIQFHYLNIDEVCEVMKNALDKGIYTRGSGGNFPRNVALSSLAGVQPQEAFDVTPYALAVNNHFLKKINTYQLPRKFKVAFSNSEADHANCTVTDIGFWGVQKDNKPYFKLYLGGGLGRNPAKGILFDELVEPKDVLYHIEAMTKLFMHEGDYINKGKARIRYIAQRMGKEDFLKCYAQYVKEEKASSKLDLVAEEKIYCKEGIEIADADDARLFKQNQQGLYSVSVHPQGGQFKLKDLKVILDELDKVYEPEIRLTMTEGFYIRNLNGKEAERILEITKDIGGSTKLERSVACIGVPICQTGILNSQKTLSDIITYFNNHNDVKKDILPSIRISGCPNSCSAHQIGEISFVGKMKKIDHQTKEVFELHIQGSAASENTKLAEYRADILQQEVPKFLYELAELIDEECTNFSKYILNNYEKFDKLICKFKV